ncbi:cutinase transcription factor 1 alpha [Stagonosporopsis vannaccii]|nr:cutinase transcription factor 1 alpha [Stagonosporopsis vannaccii]
MTRASLHPSDASQAPTDRRSEAQTGTESRPVRVRTAKACRLCNAKRVKCDASERGTPCTRCEQRGEPNCALIQSRRGIYVRKPRRQQLRMRGGVNQSDASHVDESANDTRDLTGPQGVNIEAPVAVTEAQHTRCSTAPAGVQTRDGSPPVSTDPKLDSRPHDASWSTVFEGILDRRDHREAVDKGSLAYVGEAFPLGIISRRSTDRPLLHISGPTPTSQSPPQRIHPAGIPPEDMAYLEAKRAFTAPPDAVLDILVVVFLERVFPLYPIINPQEFLLQHRARRLPWILLHSVCFSAATFCPLRILHQAGFNERKQARASFYGKAKALFDVGYENSKITTLQVAILLSFWGGSPNKHWNFYTWISTGVTIAETIGCHRSMAGINIKIQDRGLLKRLWWTLVVRDAACASMHGRPFRINLDHCDADELTMEDLEYEGFTIPDQLSPQLLRLSGLYQIQSSKLALLLRQIVTVRFYPRSQELNQPSLLHELLLHWRDGLPSSLQWNDSDNAHTDVFRTTLRILYNHNFILTHIKPESIPDTDNPLSPSTWLGDEVASLSAQQIASLACSMVTASEELVPPHELFHGLFMACVVFFVQSRSSNTMTASLGRSALTNCKMVLHVHRETWDASSWITQLFDKALSHPVGRPHIPLNDALDSQPSINNLDILDTSGMFLDGMEGWPNHLFLGDLFDPSTNTTNLEPPIMDGNFPTHFS